MKARPPTEALIAELERRNVRLAGRRTADIPELAGFRLFFRQRFYRLAEFFFGASIFNWLAAAYSPFAVLRFLSSVAFGLSFVMMFFCEFRARLMTRQLHRRAAEQVARDILGVKER